ncbi:hypothetical protein CASFOL_030302 [Castilleja foliolosa]|uniref:Uncharacterized protein n=1 Tax=Castilleja foliolosa TaxID=1961234 RepID=A0ABD3C8C6_9LAMI
MSSSGQKSEHSCASFTMRQVFKSAGCENDGTPMSSDLVDNLQNDHLIGDPQNGPHTIPTPEIYESPMLISGPVEKKDDYTQIHLLDINFPPRIAKMSLSPKQVPRKPMGPMPDAESTGSVNGDQSEIRSGSTRVEILELENEYSSEGETTMYSAETAESRNFPSPREGRSFHQVGRSQSCVNHNRWCPPQKIAATHVNYMRGMKVYSQGATSQRSNDYFSPTVSSIMKKRNLEQQNRPRMSSVQTSPKWNF